ncbi:MAG: CPBP family intramembrane metalloprotease [Victivallales bacterium]|nr:CPBP family intramembrane metalloprotease [Victivallales bacterium]
MLILQKNSFNIKDKITNIGFAISLSLIILVFLYIPIIFGLFGIKQINPLVMVLMPSLIMLPTLCISMYYAGKPGSLLHKFKLRKLHYSHVLISLVSAVLWLIVTGNIMRIYHKLLSLNGIKLDPPEIEKILQTSDSASLFLICFGVIVLAPISEELIFRRFIFGFLAPRYGFIVALLLTSAAFALVHFSLYSLPALFLLGIAFQLIYLKFGSLYPAILMHAFSNAIAVSVLLFI